MVLYLKKYHETGIFDENEIYSYITEGIGRYSSKNVDFSLIDGFTKVTDKDAAVYTVKLHLKKVFCRKFSWSSNKRIVAT
jgi:cystathionine beta-synthase